MASITRYGQGGSRRTEGSQLSDSQKSVSTVPTLNRRLFALTSERPDKATNSLLAPSLERLKKALDDFLFVSEEKSTLPDPIVVAIKGGWGAGKTYFWKNTVVRKSRGESPGYVSVFGADSMFDIRNKVVVEAMATHDALKGDIKSAVRKKGILRSHMAGIVSFFTRATGLPVLPSGLVSGVLEHYVFRRHWVICIDDVERLSDRVDFEAFLGYVSSLRDDRQVNVVLIYNEAKVVEDKSRRRPFEKYLEKVVDRELVFEPETNEVIRFVFPADIVADKEYARELKRRMDVLDLKNVRILNRVNSFLGEVRRALPNGAVPGFVHAALNSLLLFCWVKFAAEDALRFGITFEFLLGHTFFSAQFLEYVSKSNEERSRETEVKAGRLLEEFGYQHTDDLDRILMAQVRTSILSKEELAQQYSQYTSDAGHRTLHERFNSVWHDLYHGTFDDNEEDFVRALIAATEQILERIGLSSLDSALHTLLRLGRQDEAKALFDKFVELRPGDGWAVDQESLHRQPKYEPLQQLVVERAAKSKVDSRSFEETVDSAFGDDYLSDADLRRLAQFNSSDFINYFQNSNQPSITSKLRHLFRNSQNRRDDAGQTLNALVRETAETLAKLNRMNRLRIESMEIPTSEEAKDEQSQH